MEDGRVVEFDTRGNLNFQKEIFFSLGWSNLEASSSNTKTDLEMYCIKF